MFGGQEFHLIRKGLEMGLLDGKVVLVTGAARGQGRAHAVISANEGADVVAIDVDEQIKSVHYPMATGEDLAETVRQVEALGRKALSMKADVRSQEQLDAVVKKSLSDLGGIDAVIINHGIFSLDPFWEMTEEKWNDMIDVNLSGVWRTAKAVAPTMIEAGAGSIVITASVNGVQPAVNYAHYVAAKHGVIGLMKAIARELAPFGIRCNAVLPGKVLTPMVNNQAGYDMISGHENGTLEEVLDKGFYGQALRGVGWMEPENIARTALYLNSELASAVTGVSIPVDAGFLLLTGYNHNPAKG
jgi:SDR family mycofactocin-dependent oxidoreductase